MRFVLAALFAASAVMSGCGHGTREADADRIDANEQIKFDRERHPEKIVAALHIKPGSRVADIGAGTGLLTVHIARAVGPTGHVVATDVNSEVLNMMRQRLVDAKLDDVVERRVVQAEEPGLEAGAYDAILLAEVDNYFKDPIAWLKAAIPALKPGGRIVIENRVHRRAGTMAAATKAGLVVESETNPVPSHFLVVLVPGDSK